MIKYLILFLLITSALYGQISEEWRRYYNGVSTGREVGKLITTDSNGNSYCFYNDASFFDRNNMIVKVDSVGSEVWRRSTFLIICMRADIAGNLFFGGFNQSDIVFSKIDNEGNEIWRRSYNLPAYEIATTGFVDKDYNIFVAGKITSDITIQKCDSSGQLIFSNQFNGPEDITDEPTSMAVDDSGNVYVAGFTQNSIFQFKTILLKYDPKGNSLWERIYNFGIPGLVSLDNYSNAIVTGNYVTFKCSSGGSLIWQRSEPNEYPNSMRIDRFNNIYIGFGLYYDLSVKHLVKYNEFGTKQELINYGAPQNNSFYFDIDSMLNIYTIMGETDIHITKYDSTGSILADSSCALGEGERINVTSIFFEGNKVYLTGSEWNDLDFLQDVPVLKLDLSGIKDWYQVIRDDEKADDICSSLNIDSHGRPFLLGTGGYGNNTSFSTLKYKPDGSELWNRVFNRYAGKRDILVSSAVDIKGSIIATGYVNINGSDYDILTIKYDSSGNEKWHTDYTGSGGIDKPTAITTDKNCNVLVTGSSVGNGSLEDWVTIKYNADGNEAWVKIYDEENSIDIPNNVAVDQENNVYVAGTIKKSSSGFDGALIKYDNLGNQIWTRKYSGLGSNSDSFRKIKIDSSNNIYVCGSVVSDGSDDDYFLVKYDKNGSMVWERIYNNSMNSFDRATQMAIQNDKIYISGETFVSTQTRYDFLTIAYDSSGNRRWIALYNENLSYNEKPAGIDVDDEGNVYIMGEVYADLSNVNIGVVKYSNAGNQQWVTIYDNPFNLGDYPAGMIVTGNDELYVAGTTYRETLDRDMIILKYSNTIGILEPLTAQAKTFRLQQNYPNPFNPSTNLEFWISKLGFVSLKVYDALGSEVATLVNESKPAGRYTVTFDGSNLSSGIYFYKLISGDFVETKQMVLLK